jgi:hypothetical protein
MSASWDTMKTNPTKAAAAAKPKVAKSTAESKPKTPKVAKAVVDGEEPAPRVKKKAAEVVVERVKPEDIPRGRLVAVQAAPFTPPPPFVKRKPVGS